MGAEERRPECTLERRERGTWCMLPHACLRKRIRKLHACFGVFSVPLPACTRPCALCARSMRAHATCRSSADGNSPCALVCAVSVRETSQQVRTAMTRVRSRYGWRWRATRNCNPKSRTLNPSSMMQADSSATLSKPVVSSTRLRRFREPDPKNSVAFACCDQMCPLPRRMRHVSPACSCAAPKFRRIQRPFLRSEVVLGLHIRAGSTCGSVWS